MLSDNPLHSSTETEAYFTGSPAAAQGTRGIQVELSTKTTQALEPKLLESALESPGSKCLTAENLVERGAYEANGVPYNFSLPSSALTPA